MNMQSLNKRIESLEKKYAVGDAIRVSYNDDDTDIVIKKAIVMAQDIDVLDLDVRAWHTLQRARISKIYQLCDKTEGELMDLRGCGVSTVSHIKERLERLGLYLRK